MAEHDRELTKQFRLTTVIKSPIVYGIDVDCRTIDHWKSAVLALEGEEQVRSAEKDGLGTLLPMHPFPRLEKRLSLVLGDATCLGRFNVAPMHSFERITFRGDNPCRGDPTV